MITYSTTPQGSDEWLAERAGLLTASNFKKAIGSGAQRADMLDTMMFQRRTGTTVSIPKTPAMQWGNDTEPMARAYVEFMLDVDIAEVGLATNSEMPGLGASLDGLLPCGKIAIETKCPQGKTHNRYLRQGKLPAEYRQQVYGQMLVCELDGVWFCSFHPDDDKQLLIYVPRDEAIIAELKTGLDKFLSDLHKLESKNA